MSHPLTHLRLRSCFTSVSLEDIPPRSLAERMSLPVDEEEIERQMEMAEPAVPQELIHLDLDELLLDHRRWNRWEDFRLLVERTSLTEEQTLDMAEAPAVTLVTLSIGSVDRSILFPTKPLTPLCYGCKRPLDLYLMYVRDEDPTWPRGFCPGCMTLNGWKREYRMEVEAAKREGQRLPDEGQFLRSRTASFLTSWCAESRAWWADQKNQNTPRYQSWRTAWLSRTMTSWKASTQSETTP